MSLCVCISTITTVLEPGSQALLFSVFSLLKGLGNKGTTIIDNVVWDSLRADLGNLHAKEN